MPRKRPGLNEILPEFSSGVIANEPTNTLFLWVAQP
jgi:hypothetical protein